MLRLTRLSLVRNLLHSDTFVCWSRGFTSFQYPCSQLNAKKFNERTSRLPQCHYFSSRASSDATHSKNYWLLAFCAFSSAFLLFAKSQFDKRSHKHFIVACTGKGKIDRSTIVLEDDDRFIRKRPRRLITPVYDIENVKRSPASVERGDTLSVDKSGLSRSAVPKLTMVQAAAERFGVEEALVQAKLDDLLETPGKVKVTESGFPVYVPYLIIGSGTAGMAAARAIRASEPTSKVLIIGEEQYPPYMRPPLSKELWRRKEERLKVMMDPSGDMKNHSWLFFEPSSFFINPYHLSTVEHGGVALLQGKRVVHLDIHSKSATLDSGEKIQYGKCLLATGGIPRNLPVFEKASPEVKNRVVVFRNLRDLSDLLSKAKKAKSIAVVGGGFLGSELAVSLSEVSKKTGLEVFQIFKESGNLSHVLPEYLAEHTSKFVAEKGVKLFTNSRVSDAKISTENSLVTLHLDSGRSLDVDYVVVAVGIDADTRLAESSGLELDDLHGGFLVNAEMAARGDVWVAGDASSYYDVLLGRRRVEHVNHAEESGRVAGRNMAGEHISYAHQSSFWSSLGNSLAWDAIGLIDSKLETHAFFSMPSEGSSDSPPDYQYPGVVFYLQGSRVVGILLWNLTDDLYRDEKKFSPSRLNLARKILADRKNYTQEELYDLAKDFDVYKVIDDDYQDLKKYMAKEESMKDTDKSSAAS